MRVVALCNKLSRSKLKGDEVESPKIGHRPIVSNMTTGTQIQVSQSILCQVMDQEVG